MNNYHDTLGEFDGKFIRIATDDGQIFEGIGIDYTSRLDNPDGIASICIGDTELYENEIINITIISAANPAMASAV